MLLIRFRLDVVKCFLIHDLMYSKCCCASSLEATELVTAVLGHTNAYAMSRITGANIQFTMLVIVACVNNFTRVSSAAGIDSTHRMMVGSRPRHLSITGLRSQS